MTERGTTSGRYAAEAMDREKRLAPLFGKPSIARYARRLTGGMLGCVEALMKGKITVQGTQNIPAGPVLFVANHFTRSETFILPYIIDRYARRTALSLAHWSLFVGLFGDFLRAIGALSTRHPGIKGRMVADLLTGRDDWLIYPEGAMIKSKKVWHNGHFHLETPDRTGSPHTGSAVIALQTLIHRELYARAQREHDQDALEWYDAVYGLTGDLPADFHIIPINISYYPIRPGPNLVWRLAKRFMKRLPKSLDEELLIEGNLLFKDTDISIYFGKPIDLERYRTLINPGVAGLHPADQKSLKSILDALKHRVTSRLMSEIYTRLTINFDHLFCSILRHLRHSRIARADCDAMVYLVARDIQSRGQRRIHRTIDGSLLGLLTDQPNVARDAIVRLATGSGVLSTHGDEYVINQEAMHNTHHFHDVRLKNPLTVIANELEPLREAIGTVRGIAHLPHAHLRERIVDLLCGENLVEYEQDRHQAQVIGKEPKPREIGSPYFLDCPGADVGIVLSHGYLAAPAEVRGLAEHLRAAGFAVYCPRLAGHGTIPEHLDGPTWGDWQSSYDRGYAIVKHRCRHVIVAGFSAGALLALGVAARRAPCVIGCLAINPALHLNRGTSRLVPTVMAWNDALRFVGVGVLRHEWIANHPQYPDVNYERIPLRAVRELLRLGKNIDRRLDRITVPTLIVQADQDPVVDARSSERLVKRIAADDVEYAPMAFTHHGILRGDGCDMVFERVAEWARVLAHRVRTAQPHPLLHANRGVQGETGRRPM